MEATFTTNRCGLSLTTNFGALDLEKLDFQETVTSRLPNRLPFLVLNQSSLVDRYLNPLLSFGKGKKFVVVQALSSDGRRCTILSFRKDVVKTSWIISAFKIISYCTVILPLLALIVHWVRRKKISETLVLDQLLSFSLRMRNREKLVRDRFEQFKKDPQEDTYERFIQTVQKVHRKNFNILNAILRILQTRLDLREIEQYLDQSVSLSDVTSNGGVSSSTAEETDFEERGGEIHRTSLDHSSQASIQQFVDERVTVELRKQRELMETMRSKLVALDPSLLLSSSLQLNERALRLCSV